MHLFHIFLLIFCTIWKSTIEKSAAILKENTSDKIYFIETLGFRKLFYFCKFMIHVLSNPMSANIWKLFSIIEIT